MNSSNRGAGNSWRVSAGRRNLAQRITIRLTALGELFAVSCGKFVGTKSSLAKSRRSLNAYVIVKRMRANESIADKLV